MISEGRFARRSIKSTPTWCVFPRLFCALVDAYHQESHIARHAHQHGPLSECRFVTEATLWTDSRLGRGLGFYQCADRRGFVTISW